MARTSASGDEAATINVMIGTAGHIDHGKTALVHLLTGCETDTLREEKERGKSINLGFAPCTLEGDRRVGIVDVPGHEKFIRNMVAGVTGIDIVLLVVAADDGVMPQTIEHLRIVELLGIRRGMVALTKIDLVGEDIVGLATEEVRELLKGTFLEHAPIVPVSSTTGEGFDEFWAELNKLVKNTELRDIGGVFRMAVHSVFSVKGYGTVVTGIPISGSVGVGDTVELLPHGETGRIRGIEVYGSESAESKAGQCTALNVPGVDHNLIGRGTVLATPGYFHPVKVLEARLRLQADKQLPLKHNERLRLHTGTSETLCRVSLLGRRVLQPGEDGLVQFRLETPVVAGANDRFVVRSYSPPATIGGGVIISTSDRRIRRSRSGQIEALAISEQALTDEESKLEHALLEAAETPCDAATIARSAASTPERAKELLGALVESGRAVALAGGTRFVHASALEGARQRLVRMLEHFHRDEPLRLGEQRTRLRTRSTTEPALFDEAVNSLISDGTLEEKAGNTLKLASHKIALSKKQQVIVAALEKIFIETDLETPRPDELFDRIDAPKNAIEKMLDLLCESGVLIRPEPRVIFHSDTVARVREILIETIQKDGYVETAPFRDILGTSKKYTMALLDHFESTGLTVRVKSRHRLRHPS